MYAQGEGRIERAERSLDIMSLAPDQFDVFMTGYEADRATGLDDGYQASEERYAELHRLSVEHTCSDRTTS